MNSLSALKIFLLTASMLGVLACSEPPVPPGSPTSAGGDGGSVVPSSQGAFPGTPGATPVGGIEEAAPQPEFRATRGAIQGVTEFSPEAGKKLELACAAAEDAVAKGSGSRAEEQLHAMLTLLHSAQKEGLPGPQASALYAALMKDLGTLKPGSGTPKVVITETADNLCGPDGRCTVESPGALCHTATFPGMKPLCGCAEPAPPSVAAEPAAVPSEPAAVPSEPAAVPSEDAPGAASGAAEPASAPEDEEATEK